MSDEHKLLKEIDQGHKANALLGNEIYRDAMSKVRQGIHDQWAQSPLRDAEGQQTLRLMLKLLDDLEKNIVSVANTGKLALAQREHELSLKERAKKAAEGFMARFS